MYKITEIAISAFPMGKVVKIKDFDSNSMAQTCLPNFMICRFSMSKSRILGLQL